MLVAADQRERILVAMTALVNERRYESVTVGQLLARSHVSRPTFYRLFAGKEDCFRWAYQRTAAEALSRAERVSAAPADASELVRRGLGVLASALADEPAAANLVLLEPLSIGGDARARLGKTEADFVALTQRRFLELPEPVDLPPVLPGAVVAGVGRVARRRLADGDPAAFAGNRTELASWALAVLDPDCFGDFLARAEKWRAPETRLSTLGTPTLSGDEDRAIFVNAATRLLIERGFETLSPADIIAATGLPRRRFEAHFASLADCFSAAVEVGAAATVAEALAVYRAGPADESGVGRAIDALCRYLAANPGLARLLFLDVARPGTRFIDRGLRLLSGFAAVLRRRLPADTQLSEQGAEAAVGAIWALIRGEVEGGRAAGLRELSPVLTWFALAPSLAIGCSPTVRNPSINEV